MGTNEKCIEEAKKKKIEEQIQSNAAHDSPGETSSDETIQNKIAKAAAVEEFHWRFIFIQPLGFYYSKTNSCHFILALDLWINFVYLFIGCGGAWVLDDKCCVWIWWCVGSWIITWHLYSLNLRYCCCLRSCWLHMLTSVIVAGR